MCGIFFSCAKDGDGYHISDQLESLLINRGPDSIQRANICISNFSLNFFATVLHMRGKMVTQQPIYDDSNNFLLFNGEIFSHFEPQEKCDTVFLFDSLTQSSSFNTVPEVISTIRGPFAFIFYHGLTKRLWFGRDILGRRSLCWQLQEDPFKIKISSLCDPVEEDWSEIPADGIYYIDFANENLTIEQISNIRWSTTVAGEKTCDISPLRSPISMSLNRTILNEANLLSYEIENEVIFAFQQVLEKAIHKRCNLFVQTCSDCVLKSSDCCDHSSVSVLFSGGLDSTVLALLADKFVFPNQSIDLLNVAFSPKAPDRQTALIALQELQSLCCNREWNFLSIDVSLEELKSFRKDRIKHLIRPLNSVLDDSIGCALWFAARGRGTLLKKNGQYESFQSPARIILHGMGADEQLVGYSRHRKVFQDNQWKGLIEEIEKEINGISRRNLGRDDRILSDHGKEPRCPYLDEDVVNFLNSLPIHQKANLYLKRGEGEKILLRKLASKLGLIKTACNWKRAVQFGSRIANLERRGEKGNQICERLE